MKCPVCKEAISDKYGVFRWVDNLDICVMCAMYYGYYEDNTGYIGYVEETLRDRGFGD